MAGVRHDYARQAAVYDDTRGASPSIVRPLLDALRGAPGPRVVDVGGGTGNYARAIAGDGYEPIVIDVAPAMLVRARGKGLAVIRGDATAVPVRAEAVDGVLMVSMLHLVTDWRRAVAKSVRVLRPGGRLALMLYAREHLAVHWILGYFPGSAAWVVPEHQRLDEIVELLPGARIRPFEFTDLEDASMSALCRHPELLLDPAQRARTSFFERLAAYDPDELARGLDRLAHDLANGRRPDDEVAPLRAQYGDGTVIAWTKPTK